MIPEAAFERAGRLALLGRFNEMLDACVLLKHDWKNQPRELLRVGALLKQYGFLGLAQELFFDLKNDEELGVYALANLAGIALESADHSLATAHYKALLARVPSNDQVRRSGLVALEYDPAVSAADRLLLAHAWGSLVIDKAGGVRNRPRLCSPTDRVLRVGYLTADACQHTVGLFIKDILKAHDQSIFRPYVYSSGALEDWVTSNIKTSVEYKQIATLDDKSVASLIKQDQIDILVDLSGHTAGSRLSVFALRPAPVMVSWLGYFASTGLKYVDAVLLDEWHVTNNTAKAFCENIINIQGGRFCYVPVPWMPEVSELPAVRNGYVTFGSFNNTSKYSEKVFEVWADALRHVSRSRLVLKWRTFNDKAFRERVLAVFNKNGIDPARIELRGPSFHPDMLREYADIDIALDPFPFSGGLTSCEALWMGVPVVTWPQERVVSRQTYAFLSAIGLKELVVDSAENYVAIAARLAGDLPQLAELRCTLRDRMRSSPLMDVLARTRELERVYLNLYREVFQSEMAAKMKVLHVGCGHPNNGAKLPDAFRSEEWQELRFDIDPVNEPDMIGSIQNMEAVHDESVDAVYSAHNIEHVYAHEVQLVLREFCRVLDPNGYVLITCPDLQAVCQFVVDDRLTDPAYMSPAGPIAPLDIIYGHGQSVAAGHEYMAHKTGFTLKSLEQALKRAGFKRTAGKRRPEKLDLWMLACKKDLSDEVLKSLALKLLPR